MRPTILLVEDAKEILENVTEILHMYGYDVTPVMDGLEVVNTACGAKPDLILCDILLPGMNGMDVLKDIRSREEFDSVPFIFLTSHSENSDELMAKQLGADDYIIKPFDGELLIQKVSHHLGMRMQLQHRD